MKLKAEKMKNGTYIGRLLTEEGICLSTFLGLFLVDLGLLLEYSSRYPFSDDWQWLMGTSSSVVDAISFSAGSHYAPIINLLFWGSTKFGGGDMRAILILALATSAVSCFYVLMELKASRGELQLADAFVPLVMLNPGLISIYMWATTSSQVFAFALFVLILPFVLLPYSDERGRQRRFIVAGIALVLLPLQVATGLILGGFSVAAVFLKLLLDEYEYMYGWAFIFFASFFVLLGVYVSGSAKTIPHDEVGHLVSTFLFVLATSFAYVGSRAENLLGAFLLLLTFFSLYRLLFAEHRTEKPKLSQVAFVLAPLAVVSVIALFRSHARIAHSAASIPVLIAVYVILSFYAADHTKNFWSKGLFFIVAVPLLYNANYALDTARERQEWSARLQSDIRENKSIQEIAARHADYWTTGKEDLLRKGLLWAKSNGLYNLRGVKSAPLDFKRFPVRTVVVGTKERKDGYIELSGGRKDRIEWMLETPVKVQAVRLTYRKGGADPPELRVSWIPSDYESVFSATRTWPFKIEAYTTGRKVIKKTIFVNDKILGLALYSADRRSVFRVESLRFALKE